MDMRTPTRLETKFQGRCPWGYNLYMNQQAGNVLDNKRGGGTFWISRRRELDGGGKLGPPSARRGQ